MLFHVKITDLRNSLFQLPAENHYLKICFNISYCFYAGNSVILSLEIYCTVFEISV